MSSLRRLRFADAQSPSDRHRRTFTLPGPDRERRSHDLGQGDNGSRRHGDLPLRRDRQVPVLAGARGRHQSVTGTLSERPDGEVRALLVSLRVLVCAVFAVLASAAPAQAQLETAPTVIPFQDGHTPPVRSGPGQVLPSDCGDRTVASGGRDGGTYLVLGCPFTFLSFSEPQAMVEFFVRMPAGETWVFRACAAEQCSIASQQVVGNGAWTPVVLADPGGTATIREVERDTLTSGGPLDLDEWRSPGPPARHGDLRVDPVRRRRAGDVRPVLQRRGAGGVLVLARRRRVRALLDPVHGDGARGRRAHAGRDLDRRLWCRRPTPAQVTFNVAASDSDGDGGPIRPTTARASRTATRPTVTPTASATPAKNSRPATSHRSRASTRSSARSPARCS